MRLRNRKTGELGITRVSYQEFCVDTENNNTHCYKTIQGMYADWEDVPEEPKEYWYIDSYCYGIDYQDVDNNEDRDKFNKEIGNYFSSRAEAERAVDKLKAYKRLEDKGFKFEGWTIDDGLRISICTNIDSDGIYDEDRKEMKKDLEACFGGEE